MRKILLYSFSVFWLSSSFTHGKTRIAILDFAANDISNEEAITTTDVVRSMLFQTGEYEILERKKMAALLEEQGFQQTLLVTGNDSSNVEMGKLLGVKILICGSVGKIENVKVVSARIINVESGKITADVSKEYEGDSRLLLEKVLPDLLRDLTGLKNIKGSRTLDDRVNIPMWTCLGLGAVAAGFGVIELIQANKFMGEYNERGHSPNYYSDRQDKVNHADLLSAISLGSSGTLLATAGVFWYLKQKRNQNVQALILPGAIRVAWGF